MIKNFLLLTLAFFVANIMMAQTIDELKATKAEKEAALGALQGEIDALAGQIATFPGWKTGGVGTIGFNINANNNWYAISNPNSSSNGLGIGFNAFANLDVEKYFWRNGININLNRLSALTDKDNEATRSVALADLLDIGSLFGYKLSEKIAISAELKYLSSLISLDPKGAGILDDEYSFALNSPGQLTVSAGITWTPITDLVVIIHPLGYQKNWPGQFISSAGAKIGATYAKELFPGVKWSTNLTAFIPYASSADVEHKTLADAALRTVNYDGTGDLTNWLWNNGFSFTVWKGIGVGLNVGLRGDRQIANSGRLRNAATAALAVDPTVNIVDAVADLDIDDNPLQVFWNLGLSYGF